MAYIDSGTCRLVSRRDHVYKGFPILCRSLARLDVRVGSRKAKLSAWTMKVVPGSTGRYYDVAIRPESASVKAR